MKSSSITNSVIVGLFSLPKCFIKVAAMLFWLQVEHSRFALKPLTLLARSTGAPSAVSRHGSRVRLRWGTWHHWFHVG